jgi:tetratricopeptide (TPR) repeat protein
MFNKLNKFMNQFNNILDAAEQLQTNRNYRKAIKYLEKAKQIHPDDSRLNCLIAKNHQEMGEHESAEYHYDLSLASEPSNLNALIGRISLYYETGNPEANSMLEEVQSQYPEEQSLYFLKSSHSRLDPKDIKTCLSLLSKNPNHILHYALGCSFDKSAQYDRAYYHFVKANDVRSDYNPKLTDIEANLTVNNYTNRFISKFVGHSTTRPIFVVGLPRSGTTLVEKILSSHGHIGSGGELSHIYNIFRSLSSKPFTTLKEFNDVDIARCSELYLKYTENVDGMHFVDKLPDNVNMVGFIKILFPKSKIILCRRDKRDVALSCWQTNFAVIRWANNFGDISNKFRNFDRIVKHWEIIGISWFDLSYEDLIDDFEDTVSALLDFVGVGFESSCLDFHKAKSNVRTASLSQVRKPLYASSVGRWKNYSAFLGREFESLA